MALVHKADLAQYAGVEYIEIPWTVKSWWSRLWCEYMTMHRISMQLQPIALWLSLHDTTSRVKAERQAVYCHNPFPFMDLHWRDLWMSWRIAGFATLSRYAYQINIHSNRYVIVQQQWLREEFQRMYHLDPRQIIVARPSTTVKPLPSLQEEQSSNQNRSDRPYRFFFPAASETNKNFETLCQAAELLEQELGTEAFEVAITVAGTENRYGRWLSRRWAHVKSIHWLGFISPQEVASQYATTDCLVFPSRMETWGLPITEFMAYHRPILMADLPYAHETAQGAKACAFFNPHDPQALKQQMKRLIEGADNFLAPVPPCATPTPVTSTWEELIALLLNDVRK